MSAEAAATLSRDDRFELAFYFETLKSRFLQRLHDDTCWDAAADGIVFADLPDVVLRAQHAVPLSSAAHAEHDVWVDFARWLAGQGLVGRMQLAATPPRLVIGFADVR